MSTRSHLLASFLACSFLVKPSFEKQVCTCSHHSLPFQLLLCVQAPASVLTRKLLWQGLPGFWKAKSRCSVVHYVLSCRIWCTDHICLKSFLLVVSKNTPNPPLLLPLIAPLQGSHLSTLLFPLCSHTCDLFPSWFCYHVLLRPFRDIELVLASSLCYFTLVYITTWQASPTWIITGISNPTYLKPIFPHPFLLCSPMFPILLYTHHIRIPSHKPDSLDSFLSFIHHVQTIT